MIGRSQMLAFSAMPILGLAIFAALMRKPPFDGSVADPSTVQTIK